MGLNNSCLQVPSKVEPEGFHEQATSDDSGWLSELIGRALVVCLRLPLTCQSNQKP